MPHKKLGQVTRGLLTWFVENARDLPWRRTRDPYAIWVSEIMLQQTQVKTVIPYWERWMRELPSIRALAKANSNKLHKLWEGLGYYTRVRNMQKASQMIMKQHGGAFPREFEDILALPGIGRYTAGAICSIAFHQPYPVLDGNVMRLLTRVFGIAGNPRESRTNAVLWSLAEDLVRSAVLPAQLAACRPNANSTAVRTDAEFAASNLNQSLMELGALVCTARKPKCELCPLARFCVALKEDRIEDLPAASPRPQVTKRRVAAFILEHEDRFLVRQRGGDTVNAHLWEFPNVEVSCEPHDISKTAKRELEMTAALEPFCTIKHSLTHFRISMDVYRGVLKSGTALPSAAGTRWVSKAAMKRLPFASAHRKIVLKLDSRTGSLSRA
jgi:A/G-specific adenine glycosylase